MRLSETCKVLSEAYRHKRVLPVLDHLHIEGGYAVAYDGLLACAVPVQVAFSCSPHAATFFDAVEVVGDDCSITLDGSNLVLSGKGYNVGVPCTTDPFPMPDFAAMEVLRIPGLLAILHELAPFSTGEDDQAPWKTTIRFAGEVAVATKGPLLAQVDLPMAVDPFVVPTCVVNVLKAAGGDPDEVRFSPTRFVAAYASGVFVSAPTVTTPWPDVSKLTAPRRVSTKWTKEDFSAVVKLNKFLAKGRVNFRQDAVYVHNSAGKESLVALSKCKSNVAVDMDSIRAIANTATLLDIEAPMAYWEGEGIRGAIRTTAIV